MTLQLLTATGARPEAFALCHRWMQAQTYTGKVLWIVVDDGQTPSRLSMMPDNWEQVVIRPKTLWQPGQNTQARNLLAGLDVCIKNDPLAIIEDDDYYSPDWLNCVTNNLASADLVGECRARYYNIVLKRGRQLSNTKHASLCSTAMSGNAIKAFRKACESRTKFIDLALWKSNMSKRLFSGNHVVGIKGLPGRGGIGMGHRDDFTGKHDADGSLLHEWIGDDARYYL